MNKRVCYTYLNQVKGSIGCAIVAVPQKVSLAGRVFPYQESASSSMPSLRSSSESKPQASDLRPGPFHARIIPPRVGAHAGAVDAAVKMVRTTECADSYVSQCGEVAEKQGSSVGGDSPRN